MMKMSLPFTDVGFAFGHGPVSKAVGSGLDRGLDWMRFGNPVGRSMGGLFDYRVNRGTDAVTQKAWATAGQDALEKGKVKARLDELAVLESLDPAIRNRAATLSERDVLAAARAAAEGTSHAPILERAASKDHATDLSQLLFDMQPLGDRVSEIGQRQLQAARQAGLPLDDLADDYSRYTHRQSINANQAALGLRSGNAFPLSSASNLGREQALRNIPGGTERINSWTQLYAGNQDAAGVGAAVYRDLLTDLAGLGITPDVNLKIDMLGKAKSVAAKMGQLDPLHAELKLPLFTPDLAGTVARRGSQHARTVAAAEAAKQSLADAAVQLGQHQGEVVPLSTALAKLRLKTTPYNQETGELMQGAMPGLYRKLAPKGAGMVDSFLTGETKALREAIDTQWALPRDKYDAILKNYGQWSMPEEVRAPIRLFDSATNAFKSLVYPLWPASHVRNVATAAYNNMRTGTNAGDYLKQLRFMRGHLDPAEAAQMRAAQYGHARIFDSGNNLLDVVGASDTLPKTAAERVTKFLPGTNQWNPAGRTGPWAGAGLVGDAAHTALKTGTYDLLAGVSKKVRHPRTAPNPLAMAGVGKSEVDRFAPLIAGRRVSANIEDFMRGAQFNGMVRQGYSPAEAAANIRKYHFEYQDLTPFEKNVMRRAVPFYTFARKNLPLQVQTALTRPAVVSSPFKLNQSDPNEYVPDYLRSGFVAPLGKEVDGERRFISSLGLPQEEAFKELKLWNGVPDLRGTAMSFAGNLNPYIKGALEQMTGKQFYTGRDLSDLHPTRTASAIGSLFNDDNPQLLTQIIANTPLTRFATSLDKMTDPRKPLWAKAANLASGVRVSDVNVAHSRFIEQREALKRMLSGKQHVSWHESPYARPEDKPLLDQETAEQLQMFSDMQQRGREYMRSLRNQRIGVRSYQ
jgi:hypothetical protein